jgi:signal transduction histidine kinase
VKYLMADAMPALEAANLGKGLSLEVRIADSIGPIRLRYRTLKSILLNLATNAIKFTAIGSILISFKRVSTRDTPKAIELTVSDTGPGIDSTMLAVAFKRCAQLSNSSARKFRGMELGLPVVKHNVDYLGGN